HGSAQVRSESATLALGPREMPDVDLAAWFRNEVFRQQRARVTNQRNTEALAGEQRVPADDEGFSVVWHAPRWGVQRFDVGADLRRISGTSFERLFPPSGASPAAPTERNGGGVHLPARAVLPGTLRPRPPILTPAPRRDPLPHH